MSSSSPDDEGQVPSWAIYAGVGIASYVAYKTLFKESKFVHEWSYQELKSDDYSAEYSSSRKYYVTNPWDEKPIMRSRRGPASWKPVRVFEMLEKAVSNAPDSVFWKKEYLVAGSETDYVWKSWTRKEVLALSLQAARAFIACGLKPWQAVSIIGFNAPEWLLALLGCIHSGGIAAGIYTTNNPGQCKYIAAHSKSAVAVVENKKQLAKFLEIRGELEHLTHIVVWDMDPSDAVFSEQPSSGNARVIHWSTFMAMGDDAALESERKERVSRIRPGQCCTLIYTSGTTGPPKAVMISHDNVTWQARSAMETMQSLKKDGSPHSSVSYLPLSHIAAQLLDVFYPVAFAATYPACKRWTVHFARPTALKGTLSKTLQEARPTLFFGVPRVWEKIQEAIVKKARAAPPSAAKKMLIDWLKDINLRAYRNRQCGGSMVRPFGHSLAEKLLVGKIRAAMGFDRVQCTYTGAAPTAPATLEFWGSLGFDLIEAYGMSETCGVHTIALPYHHRQGTVGVPLAGATTLLRNDPHRDAPGHGEICMRGRHIMMGYMYDEDRTKRAVDDEGYVHSGDVGTLLEDFNLLRITGRIKELIITAGGENIAPVPIEDYLKAQCEGISNVMVVGDQKKYLTALLTLKVAQNRDSMTFSNQLDGAAKAVDAGCKTVDEARGSGVWKEYIQRAIDQYNGDRDYCVSNAQRVQYFRILDADFGVESGELTATMKLKRPVVAKKYHAVIESMYSANKK